MLAPEQKKNTKQLICVQCWVLILIIKFFVICLFYKIVLHCYSLTDAHRTSFGEFLNTLGSKGGNVHGPLNSTS